MAAQLQREEPIEAILVDLNNGCHESKYLARQMASVIAGYPGP